MKPKGLAKTLLGASALTAAIVVTLTANPAQAATISWDGDTSTAWATGTNWTGNVAPANDLVSDIALFNLTTYPNQPDAGTTSVNGIQVGDGSTATGALTLSGTSLTLGSSGINMLANAGAATISSPIVLGAAQTWNNSSANALTVSGIVSGSSPLIKSGNGQLILSGANTFTGGLTINAGTVSIAANNNLGANSSPVTLNGGTLKTTQTGGTLVNTHAVTIGAGGGTIYAAGTAQFNQNSRINFNTANTLLGSGPLTITGNGFVDQYGGSGTVVLGAANNGVGGYSGNITLQNGGMLTYEAVNALASAATITLNNNTEFAVIQGTTASNNITVNGGTNSNLSFINGNTGVISGNITLNANATIGLRDWYNNATVRNGTISGAISGTGGLTINSGYGSGGVLTLSGANTYTGNTVVTASKLTLNGNTGSLVSNANIRLNAGTFNYQGASTGSTLDASGYTFSGVDRTYEVTYGTSGNTSLNLADATRAAGSTNNYVVTGGTNGTTNKITFNSAPATGVLVDKGNYFNGTSYLAYDVGGFARAYDYSADANGAISTGGTTLGSVTGMNVDLTTSAVTAQTTDSINTLRLGTTNGVTITAGNTLSVNGILKSGGNAATIAGGSIQTTASGGEMVIRSNTADTLTITSVIADNGNSSLTKSGPGTLALNAANTYAGGTTLGGGIVTFNNNSSFGTGTITSQGGGTIRSTAGVTTTNNLVVNGQTVLDVTGGNWNLNGNISGSGDIIRGGSANISLFLGGDNSGYTGTFTVPNTGGNTVVRFSSANSGSANAKWVFSNATAGRTSLEFATGTINFGSLSGSGFLTGNVAGTKTVSVGALNLDDHFTGVIQNGTGTIALTKVGTGTLSLYGANTYTGGTNINSGSLQINNANALGTSGTISFGGGTLKYGSVNTDLSARFSNAASQAYKVDTNGNNVTWASALTSSGGMLTKQGTGTLTLTAANTYTDGTLISAGVLATSLTGSFGLGNVTLADVSGAGLALGNGNSIADTATLFFGDAATIALNNATSDTLFGITQTDDSQSIGAGVYTASDLNTFFGVSSFSGTGTLTVVPEPAVSLLGGLGLLGILRRRRTA